MDHEQKNTAPADPTMSMIDWLLNRNPLVTFTRQRSVGRPYRSMGFVYASLPSGRNVLCTCRHDFLEVEDLGARTLLGGFNREERYDPLHAIPLYAEDDRDICFIVARRETVVQRLKLLDAVAFDKWHASEEGILYNCRNAIGERADSQFDVAQQEIGPPMDPTHRAWINIRDEEIAYVLPETDTVKLPALRERGYHEHGYICMYTRPGCSGSPIWDDQFRLIGMNIRGTCDGDAGDYCGYVYAGDIRRAFEALRPQILEIDRQFI